MSAERNSFWISDFNPRPREEGDIMEIGIKYQNADFNPRPREEGDYPDKIIIICFINFNPRPREEGDLFIAKHTRTRYISIHALVKRATQVLNASWDKIFISIHALVKRATD